MLDSLCFGLPRHTYEPYDGDEGSGRHPDQRGCVDGEEEEVAQVRVGQTQVPELNK